MSGVFSVPLVAVAIAQTVAASPDTPSSQVADVVVTAERPAVVEQIDRRVHDIAGDPLVQTTSVLDILGKLPSVTVTPTGTVQLLGASGVKVLIDGKPPLNADQELKNLLGSDVDRIEVMTNPSARYASDGGAGIINIITRKRRRPGLSGSLMTSGDSLGAGRVTASPTWTFGKWSVGLTASASHSRNENDRRRLRQILQGGTVVSTIEETTDSLSRDDSGSAKLRLGYKPDDRQSWTLTLEDFEASGPAREETRFASGDAGFAPYREIETGDNTVSDREIDLGYEWTGKQPGETLTLDAAMSAFLWKRPTVTRDEFDDPGLSARRYDLATRWDQEKKSLKVDYQRPLPGKRLLSVGGSWEREDQDSQRSSHVVAGVFSPSRSYDLAIDARRGLGAVYATLQVPLGKWTVLPGVRYEAQSTDVRSQGALGHNKDSGWRPSLHLDRALGEGVKLKLSYVQRVDRPGISDLDPSIQYYGPNQAWGGNPDLKPSPTQSYEGQITIDRHGRELGLTVYDRETRRTLSSFTRLTAEGISLTTQINAGEETHRGVEVSVRGKLGPHWKYATTANLFQARTTVLEGGVFATDEQLNRSGNLQIDYKAPEGKTANQVQFSIRYSGPERTLQGDTKANIYADLTWRRPITPKVSAVLTVTDLFDNATYQSRLETENLIESSNGRGAGRLFKLSLTYKLGAKG